MRYGLVNYKPIIMMIEQRAYYKWLDGSNDTDKNWLEAEFEVFEYLRSLVRGGK